MICLDTWRIWENMAKGTKEKDCSDFNAEKKRER